MTRPEFDRTEILEEQQGFSINFAEIRSMAYRQRYIMGAIILVALLIGVAVTIVSPAIYQAEVKIQIDPDSNDVLTDSTELSNRLRGADVQRYLNSQVDLIKSRSMAQRVATDLDLNANDTFLVKMGEQPVEIAGEGTSLERARLEQVVATLVANIDITLPFGNKVATITFDSRDEELAQRVANAYAKSLITGNIEQRYEASSYARDFLESEIADAKQRLEEAERQALLYARNTQIIDASDGVGSTDEEGRSAPRSITTANLVQMNTDLAEARTNRILAQQEWEAVRGRPPLEISAVQNNPAIQSLLSEKAAKESQLRELLDRYKPDHPVAVQAAAQLNSLDSEINAIATSITGAIRYDYEIKQRQEASLASNLEQLKDATLEEQNKRVQLNLLAREVETNRAQYQSLLERFEEVNTSADVVTNNISIIDEAQSAEKIAPQPLINMLLAGVIGLAIAFLVAFLRETFDDSIRTPDDASRKLGLPLLGTTPVYKQEDPLIETLSDRKSAIAEAYSSIRSSLDFSTSEGAPKSILLTSSQPSEGKSTSAVAIAESFARAGKRTLLVDGDLRNPSLHKYLGVENNMGFVSTLTGNANFDTVISKPADMHFDFLSCGPIPPDPTEIIVSHAITRFIKSVEGRYDHILFDGPPVMGLADSPQMSRAVGGTVLVVEAGRIRGGQTKSAIRRLNDADATLLGLILSKFDGVSSGYGEYYGYQYNYVKRDD
ncbi:MAG: polysaccharide biosynthesis tyrosine autokinase [Pseudomonadota bacterium]